MRTVSDSDRRIASFRGDAMICGFRGMADFRKITPRAARAVVAAKSPTFSGKCRANSLLSSGGCPGLGFAARRPKLSVEAECPSSIVPFPAGDPADGGGENFPRSHERKHFGRPILVETVTGRWRHRRRPRRQRHPDGYPIGVRQLDATSARRRSIRSPGIRPRSRADRAAAGLVADDRRQGSAAG